MTIPFRGTVDSMEKIRLPDIMRITMFGKLLHARARGVVEDKNGEVRHSEN